MRIDYMLVLCDINYDDNVITKQSDKLPCVLEVNKVDRPHDIVVKLSDNMDDRT